MPEISVARGLSQIKLLEKRISKGIESLSVRNKIVTIVKISEDEDHKKKFKENAASTIQSIADLIQQRVDIKRAIIKSNAETFITIGSESITVAAAIERKLSIEAEKNLLRALKNAYFPMAEKMEKNIEIVAQQAEKHAINLLTNMGDDKDKSPELYQSFYDKHLENNSAVLLAPDGIESKIEEEDKSIDEFEADVDHLLSESNIKTMIQV